MAVHAVGRVLLVLCDQSDRLVLASPDDQWVAAAGAGDRAPSGTRRTTPAVDGVSAPAGATGHDRAAHGGLLGDDRSAGLVPAAATRGGTAVLPLGPDPAIPDPAIPDPAIPDPAIPEPASWDHRLGNPFPQRVLPDDDSSPNGSDTFAGFAIGGNLIVFRTKGTLPAVAGPVVPAAARADPVLRSDLGPGTVYLHDWLGCFLSLFTIMK